MIRRLFIANRGEIALRVIRTARRLGMSVIVGATEADPGEQKLSNESPIGKALTGHKRGDVVTIDVPRGPKKRLKITKIEAA